MQEEGPILIGIYPYFHRARDRTRAAFQGPKACAARLSGDWTAYRLLENDFEQESIFLEFAESA
jgi:hypothetical protein